MLETRLIAAATDFTATAVTAAPTVLDIAIAAVMGFVLNTANAAPIELTMLMTAAIGFDVSLVTLAVAVMLISTSA